MVWKTELEQQNGQIILLSQCLLWIFSGRITHFLFYQAWLVFACFLLKELQPNLLILYLFIWFSWWLANTIELLCSTISAQAASFVHTNRVQSTFPPPKHAQYVSFTVHPGVETAETHWLKAFSLPDLCNLGGSQTSKWIQYILAPIRESPLQNTPRCSSSRLLSHYCTGTPQLLEIICGEEKTCRD